MGPTFSFLAWETFCPSSSSSTFKTKIWIMTTKPPSLATCIYDYNENFVFIFVIPLSLSILYFKIYENQHNGKNEIKKRKSFSTIFCQLENSPDDKKAFRRWTPRNRRMLSRAYFSFVFLLLLFFFLPFLFLY